MPATSHDADEQSAQTEAGKQGEAQAQKETTKPGGTQSADNKAEWVFAPIPISSPAIGSGLEWAVAPSVPV
jgi:hypothetical protein